MNQVLPTRFLDPIAAAVRVGRKRLPCAALRDLLSSGRLPRCSRLSVDRALLLAAVTHALLVAVRADWQGTPLTQPAQFDGQCRDVTWQARPKLVAAWRFQFAPWPHSEGLRLPRATYGWLAALDPVFVASVVRWSPPVVSPVADLKSPIPVLGNVVTAFLAQRVSPDTKVWVRVLGRAGRPKFSLLDLAGVAIPSLTPIVAQYRDRIVGVAPTATIAEQVTGLQRAMAFRIRQRLGGGIR